MTSCGGSSTITSLEHTLLFASAEASESNLAVCFANFTGWVGFESTPSTVNTKPTALASAAAKISSVACVKRMSTERNPSLPETASAVATVKPRCDALNSALTSGTA